MQRSTPFLAPLAAPVPWDRWRRALAAAQRRFRDPATRGELLWHALWSPFSVWSDAPPPELPHREPPAAAQLGQAGQAVVAGIDRARRRLWLNHAAAAICRSVWIGLLVAALLMLIDALGGPGFDPRLAVAIGSVFLIAGIILAALSRPSRQRTARMLDRTFSLQERLTTALDDLGLGVPGPGERAPVVYLQMADAANAVAVLRGNPRLRPAIPVREIVLVILVALILTTLAFLRGLGGGLPELGSPQVLPFTPAIERPPDPQPSAADIAAAKNPPTVQEVLEQADRSSRARHDLQTLAAALADHAATRPAAEQIARGDYEGARDQLNDTADRAGDLSQSARSALSSDLEQAASRMQPETNGLQEATADAASGLRQDAASAQSGMRELADAVARAGKEVVPPGTLASQMRGAQQSQSQGGQGQSRSGSRAEGDLSNASTRFSAAGDPGNGVPAEATSNDGSMDQQRGQEAQSGSDPGNASTGEQSPDGQPGQSNTPGDGQRGGAGQNGAPGDAANDGAAAGRMPGDRDSASARQGAGAGTGSAAELARQEASSAAASRQTGAGAAPADPNVANGGSAEAETNALGDARDRVALPGGDGQEGVQTASDGGAALRGSGAGVTAGSGYAEQGEVGEAGPDSNRVPPEHRETVERYFSNGSGE